MKKEAEIPCATCRSWKPKARIFACDPNRCHRLSNWLMKHAANNTIEPPNKLIQYIV